MTTLTSALPRHAHPKVRAALEADRASLGQRDNVGEVERWVSGIAGAALVAEGLRHRSLGGLALAAVGGSLLYRGATGYCGLYDRMGISTADSRRRASKWGRPADHGILVKRSVTVNRPVEEVFSFWRHFENFPRFMLHLESVKTTDATHSRWIARGPMGSTIEWDAEIFNEKPNELIAWRSLDGSEIDHAGSVRFRTAPGDRGTEVLRRAQLRAPRRPARRRDRLALRRGAPVQIEDDLRRFKQVMEAGEIATVDGQPKGR